MREELAARFFADELDRDPYAAAIWIQFGHTLKEAGRIPEAGAVRGLVGIDGGVVSGC